MWFLKLLVLKLSEEPKAQWKTCKKEYQKMSVPNALEREMWWKKCISETDLWDGSLWIRSIKGISYPEVQPYGAKVTGTGFLEGRWEPLVLCLDFLFRTQEKLGTSQYGIQNICFCILSSDYLYGIFKKQSWKLGRESQALPARWVP